MKQPFNIIGESKAVYFVIVFLAIFLPQRNYICYIPKTVLAFLWDLICSSYIAALIAGVTGVTGLLF